MRFVGHVRALWGRRWILPLIPALYALLLLGFGQLRPEHVLFGVVCAVLAFIGPRSKQFLTDISPYVAVGIAYDLVRYARPVFVTAERVLGCELREAELLFFRVAPNTTFQDYFARHNSPFFDVLFAVPYTIFVYLVVAYAGYLYFRDRQRMRHYLLAFAIGNFISFACWLIVPAAPPWYLHAHGCVIDATALPSSAGLARVDALFGIDYYATFYGRASSIFGAMPSMHCAYPLIGLLTAWKVAGWRARSVHLTYTLIMATAAVYLDHHWVLDVLGGWITGLAAVLLAGWWLKRPSRQRASAPTEAHAGSLLTPAVRGSSLGDRA